MIDGASSSRCSAARRRRGRSRRARSRRRSCRPSGSWARARLRLGANGPPPSCSGCANSAGSRVAPSRSSIAGRRDAPSASPRSRPSSSGSRSMSLSRRNAASRRGKAGDIGHPDRLRDGGRPGRQRLGREPGAAGRQRHRPVDPAGRSCWQAARTLARGCPRSSPVGDHGQRRQSRRRAGDGRGLRQRPARSASKSSHSKSERAEDIAPAFEALKGRADALYVCGDPLVNTNRIRINTLGARRATADDVRLSGVRRSGRSDVLWTKLPGPVPARRRICRQDSARGEAGRHPGRAADQIRSGHQSDDRQGARPRRCRRRCSPAPTR